MANSRLAPGSFEFKKVLLKDHGIDIRFKVLEINVFESLFQSCMTADITLLDAENMVANLPIIEGNIVEIHLAPNSDDRIQQNIDPDDLKCTMEVIKITSRIKTTSQDVQTYNLRLASIGWSDNVRTRISRAYDRKKYSDIAKEIFDDKFGKTTLNGSSRNDKKELVVEDTYGEKCCVIPRLKPIQAFNWLAGRSQSKENRNAVNYLFWEDKDQYNFKSVESLLKEKATDTYYVKLQNVDQNDHRNYFNIFNYTYHDTGDILLYANNGTFGSRLITHDVVTKQVTDHFSQGEASLNYKVSGSSFDYVKEFGSLAHCDGGGGEALIDSDVSETLSESPGNTRLFVQPKHMKGFAGMDDDKSEEWLRERTMQKPILKYIRLTLQTVGRFSIKCGTVIKIDLPSPEEEKGKQDARLKGNYLVTSVRRIFKPTRHEVVMEVMKDNFLS